MTFDPTWLFVSLIPGGCGFVLFMYGPDADRLFNVTSRRLRASRLAKGGWVVKRYGAVDDDRAREVRINL